MSTYFVRLMVKLRVVLVYIFSLGIVKAAKTRLVCTYQGSECTSYTYLEISSTPNSFRHFSAAMSITFVLTISKRRALRKRRRVGSSCRSGSNQPDRKERIYQHILGLLRSTTCGATSIRRGINARARQNKQCQPQWANILVYPPPTNRYDIHR